LIVEFDKSFAKSVDKLQEPLVLKKIEGIIIDLENAGSIPELSNVRKLKGYKTYYRIRIGDYRLGFEMVKKDTIRLIIIAHRKDIYSRFP
jgi:mRNA interferase RelE/StbE